MNQIEKMQGFFNAAQDPRGCRFIFGEPGQDHNWRYCQAPTRKGSAPGNPLNPPYCREHAKLCCPGLYASVPIGTLESLANKILGNEYLPSKPPPNVPMSVDNYIKSHCGILTRSRKDRS